MLTKRRKDITAESAEGAEGKADSSKYGSYQDLIKSVFNNYASLENEYSHLLETGNATDTQQTQTPPVVSTSPRPTQVISNEGGMIPNENPQDTQDSGSSGSEASAAAKLLKEYKNVINDLNLNNENTFLYNSDVTKAIDKLMDIVKLGPSAGEAYKEAVEIRNKLVKKLFAKVNGNTFNIKDLKNASIHMGASNKDFNGTRYNIKHFNKKGAGIDGSMKWKTGKEFVSKMNRFIQMGGKIKSLVIAGHGIRNTIFNEGTTGVSGNRHQGLYYGNGYTYGTDGTGENAANINAINFKGAVKDGATIFMQNCQGADDAKEWMKEIIKQNPGIKGLKGLGRNYDGNWNGGSDGKFADRIWINGQDVGYQRWVQDGNELKNGGFFRHSASDLLKPGLTIQERKEMSKRKSSEYRAFIKEMNKGVFTNDQRIFDDLE